MRARLALGRVVLPVVALVGLSACNEEQHGFLKIGANALFDDGDRLECGEAKITPQPGGLVDAFVTLKPQDCTLTLYRRGEFMSFGTSLCKLHVANNRITTVYLSERDGVLACSGGSS